MIKWINIQEKAPPEGVPILFYSLHYKSYNVGYWSECENCMNQYDPDMDQDGWKMDVLRWSPIPDDNTTITEIKMPDVGYAVLAADRESD